MMDVKTAISILEVKFPYKRIDGNPAVLGDLFVFRFVDKNATKEEIWWDNTVVGVDRITGEISWHSSFDKDIIPSAKPILE